MMGEKKLGVLIHGAGWVSGEHIRAFNQNPHTRVVAISSRKLESCQKRAEEAGLEDVAFYTDYEKALAHEGVDIVSVCTPQQLHPENTIAAAEAGKHVVIEKAIATNVKDMRAMADAVKKAGVKTVVSFVLRWNPLFDTLKALIADDAVGDVFYTEADYQHDISSWWTGYEEGRTKALGVNANLVTGCHALDAARWFAAKGRYERRYRWKFRLRRRLSQRPRNRVRLFLELMEKAPPWNMTTSRWCSYDTATGRSAKFPPITAASCLTPFRWRYSEHGAPSRTTASGHTSTPARTTGLPFPAYSL